MLRFRLRTSMGLVVFCAVVMAAPIKVRRRATRRQLAYHTEQIRIFRDAQASLKQSTDETRQKATLGVPSMSREGFPYSGLPRMLTPSEWAELAARFEKSIPVMALREADHAAMVRKYHRAAYRPWEPLPEDPWISFIPKAN